MDDQRRKSMPELSKRQSKMFDTPPPFLPPRKPVRTSNRSSRDMLLDRSRFDSVDTPRVSITVDRPSSLPSIPDTDFEGESDGISQPVSAYQSPTSSRPPSINGRRADSVSRRKLQSRRAPPLQRGSSLRISRRLSEDDQPQLMVHPSLLATVRSAPSLRADQRPHSHPPMKGKAQSQDALSLLPDPWKPLPLPPPSPAVRALAPRPRASFTRLSSLDNVITYREEVANWKRASSLLQFGETAVDNLAMAQPAHPLVDGEQVVNSEPIVEKAPSPALSVVVEDSLPVHISQTRFRSLAAEVGFCFTIATQMFLSEYLISGFALALPELMRRVKIIHIGNGTLGFFWPASLLTLTLSATILVFARLADIYGGYGLFMLGTLWLGIWSLIPGFFSSAIILDVSRAMQGLALAAFTPSTFVLVSTFYENGPRKNFVLGLYSGCAPVGFFAGILVAAALPPDQSQWYLWIAAILAFTTAVTSYLTVPHDWTNRKQLGLKMDWLGALLITAGLMLVSYALAYEPDADMTDRTKNGFSYPSVYGPFTAGMLCLFAAIWVEGWYAKCPLLPFDFFKPKSCMAICLAGLCFYASYGVWLYESAEFFQSGSGTTAHAVRGIELALWYLPTAIGGLILCVTGASLMHIVPMKVLLLISGVAWVGAPLLLGLCPLPVNYWAFVLPSMLCATLGIDLTFTISLVYFSSTQPKRYQGLCGAMCSILVNLAISFGLPLSEIIENRAASSISCDEHASTSLYLSCMNKSINWSYRAMFFYAAASALCGLIICVLFVHFPVQAKAEKPVDEERPRETSSEASSFPGRYQLDQ
ncbi:hypothetical protein LTR62_005963 [Meristemomyces frigidus]|uniref:Major facilitator superfamily (MFS) profile domain-containing protein n=1 Tax=Meristemomyces frigidus TaxID=1508187 RepID=A0AAN7TW13_9PEZI|nr:hypothetical protein LTR62_005963 [Meristemomyces frigidus]